ncbi:MAG: gamma carbonic anhydrase family protein [Acidimicrobiia bacterium]|nr:gamma carbonic anhydrase family protein [Acidimicrobiia bacterium]
MAVYALGGAEPKIHPTAFVHPQATVIGNVEIGAEASIWPSAVLRGDEGFIRIGDRTSVQDCSVLHTTAERPTIVGNECVIGHIVHLEACTVEDRALVGNGAVVLHRAVIRTGSLVGSNAVVPNDMEVPTGAMALGVPAKIREGRVTPEMIMESVEAYIERARIYRSQLRRLD